jgi:hypothetical protein
VLALSPIAGGLAKGYLTALRTKPLLSFWPAVLGETVIIYLTAFPLLLLIRWAGARRLPVFILTAALGALPLAYTMARPDPTAENIAHGPYWFMPSMYVLLTSLTGLVFGLASQPGEVSSSPGVIRFDKNEQEILPLSAQVEATKL